MLNLNEIKVGKLIRISDEPYIVIRADHHKTGRGGAVLKTKLKNLITLNVLEKTFQGADKAEEAETETKKANFMYVQDGEANFMDNTNYEQFSFPVSDLGGKEMYMKEGTDVDILYFDERPVSVNLPIKIELKVVSTPPGVKGNSVGSVTKIAVLETGAEVNVPMFVKEGDVLRINTDSGEYVERV